MGDLEIINSINTEPIRPPEHVSIDEIINSVPCMSLNNPATYSLYLYYNKTHLESDEKDMVNAVIEKLKLERSAINKKNIEYMNRHKESSQ